MGGSMMKNGRETGGITKIPPVPQRLCTKAFRAKTGGREGKFEYVTKLKINSDLFGSLLVYSYLCSTKGTCLG
jgi:hypothetical protein